MVHSWRVFVSLKTLIINLLRGEEGVVNLRVTDFEEVILLGGHGYEANNLHESFFIDNDIVGVNIANFMSKLLKVFTQCYQVVEEVPNFAFLIRFVNFVSVEDLFPQQNPVHGIS